MGLLLAATRGPDLSPLSLTPAASGCCGLPCLPSFSPERNTQVVFGLAGFASQSKADFHDSPVKTVKGEEELACLQYESYQTDARSKM